MSVIEVSASTGGGNFSTMPQAANVSEVSNLLRSMQEKSKGNLTQLNLLLFDEMERRNMINEEEKKDLATYFVGLNKIKPTRNITDQDIQIISLIDNIGKNTTNSNVTALKTTLKNVAPDLRNNTATLITNLGNNTLPGLPVTIDAIGDFGARYHLDAYGRCSTYAAIGHLVPGVGAGVGGVLCTIM